MELMMIEGRKVLGRDFRVYGTIEEPLFLARDVAEWIGYEANKVNELVNMADDEEKLTATITWSGQRRKMWLLTEDGLYEVLMQSRMPIAKEFRTHVKRILKEIRLNKGYVVKGAEVEFAKKAFSYLSPEALDRVIGELQAHNIVLKDHVDALEEKVDVLGAKVDLFEDRIMELANRSFIVAVIRRFAVRQFYGEIPIRLINGWQTYYQRLLYSQHGISLNGRKKLRTGERLPGQAQRLAYLTDEEVPFAVKMAVALCDEYGVDISDLLQDLVNPGKQQKEEGSDAHR